VVVRGQHHVPTHCLIHTQLLSLIQMQHRTQVVVGVIIMAEVELLPDIEFMGREECRGDIYNISKILLIKDDLKKKCPKYNIRLIVRCEGVDQDTLKNMICQRKTEFKQV